MSAAALSIMDARLIRLRTATLPVAFAASVAVHVSTFAALVGIDGGPKVTAPPAMPAQAPVLEARLVAPPPASTTLPTVPAATVAALAPPAAPPEIPPLERSVSKARHGAGAGEQSPVGWKPSVVFTDRVPRARFGEALDGDALAAFSTEVDVAVAIPERIDVPYPREALAARKEGAVLAWAVIDDQGKVDSVHVVEGDPEFAAAVEAALMGTRFGPARNLGQSVPFYVTLEFEFRLDATGGAVAEGRTTAGAR
jgi:TonB family protein